MTARTGARMTDDLFSFRLPDDMVADWRNRPVRWGFDVGGGNALGEIVFVAKYSRVTGAGGKERWVDCVRRVVDGTFSILYDHCRANGCRWDAEARRRDAERMFAGLFEMRWLPPGRGLWMMGTPFVREEGGAALQNCAFLSTRGLGGGQTWQPFVRLMEMSMLGIGVGFDTLGRDRLAVGPEPTAERTCRIADTREGWCESVRLLLTAFLQPNQPLPRFDYGLIRPAGRPIVRFGGVASGPGPLRVLHRRVLALLRARSGHRLSSVDIVDLMNMIGKCVAAGNIGRSAEIALGGLDDPDFLALKDPAVNPTRLGPDGWGHVSNNSVVVRPGEDCTGLLDRICGNGEPGLFFLDNARRFGRLVDPPDDRDHEALGTNPCAEQTLHDNECCTLVETFPTRHRSLDEYLDTIRSAMLYAKAVTLVPTRWPEVTAVMNENRRIGCSVSGLAQFLDTVGIDGLTGWLDTAYQRVRAVDRALSAWLDVPRSIKLTSVKPSGTVSLLAGVSPGVHFPEGAVGHGAYIRRLRCPADGPLAGTLAAAGYPTEPDLVEPTRSVVVDLPVAGQPGRVAAEVALPEKLRLAAVAQSVWADNQVSVTVGFREDERPLLRDLLAGTELAERLKSVSFLPATPAGAYPQMPYEAIDAERFGRMRDRVWALDGAELYGAATEPDGERYCTTDVCSVVPERPGVGG